MEIVLDMFFLKFGIVDIKFAARKLTWRSYIVTKILPIAKQVEPINKYILIQVALDKNFEIFVLYIAGLKVS